MNCEQKPMYFCNSLCFLVFNLFRAVLSELVEVPSNDFILEHNSFSSIDMTCRSDYQNRLKWNVRENNDSANEVFYNGYYLREDARSYCTAITDEPRKCYLRLRNAPQVAKTYICVEPGSLREASADLIWIKGDPVCSDNSVENLINLTCSIEFRGNWAPTMEWKEHNSLDEKVLSVGVNTLTISNQRVTSTLTMPVQKGSRNYTCATRFETSAKPRSTTATNVPDYYHVHVWTASVLPTTEDDIVEGEPTNEIEDEIEGRSPNDIEDKIHILPIIIGITIALVALLLITAVIIFVITKRRVQNENQKHWPVIEVDKFSKKSTSRMEKGLPVSRTLLDSLASLSSLS